MGAKYRLGLGLSRDGRPKTSQQRLTADEPSNSDFLYKPSPFPKPSRIGKQIIRALISPFQRSFACSIRWYHMLHPQVMDDARYGAPGLGQPEVPTTPSTKLNAQHSKVSHNIKQHHILSGKIDEATSRLIASRKGIFSVIWQLYPMSSPMLRC